jgi:TolB protein
MKTFGRIKLWIPAVLSALLLQACKSAGTLALAASMWSVIIITGIVYLPFLPLTLIDELKGSLPGPVAVAYLPGGDEMVVIHKEGDERHLARLDTAGLAIVPLTTGKRFDLQPDVSRDGRQIVFASATVPKKSKGKMTLCIEDIDGSNLRPLTDGASQDICPRFSPDGKQVVYASSIDGKEADIFVVDVAGGPPRRLTSGPENDFYPIFLPDNERILFARAALFGDERVAAKGWRHWDWYTVRSDGSDLKRLTDVQFCDITSPELSPDGAHVLFSPGFGRYEETVSLLHLDGSPRVETLTPQGSQYNFEEDSNRYKFPRLERAHFSPEGDVVLFTIKKQENKQDISEVHRMDLKTGEAQQLTHLGVYISDFACSPKGDSLALLISNEARKKSKQRTELRITNMDGTNPRSPEFNVAHKGDPQARGQ